MVDRCAPGVRISRLSSEKASSGEPLELGGRLLAFSYEDCERKADKVSLRLDNFDLSLFVREDLAGGSLLLVSWGYPGDSAPPRRVVIDKTKGFAQLTVEGHALSTLMNKEVRTRSWESSTRAEVVEEVAAELGYEGEHLHVEGTDERFDVINQTGQTDAAFLRLLAEKEGVEFWVDDSGLHWHERRQDGAPSHVLTYYTDPGRGEILSVSMESDLSRRVGKVVVKGRDPLLKETFEEAADSGTVDRDTLGDVVEVVDPVSGETSLRKRVATRVVRPTSAGNAARAAKEARARFVKAERAANKLVVKVVGDPSLRAKSIVALQGISPLLSGKYYVTSVKHDISGSGYTCELRVTRDGKGRVSARDDAAQGGRKNENEPSTGGKLKEVEVVDPVTGETFIEYREEV